MVQYAPQKALSMQCLDGYKCLDGHVVDVRHQHELQQGLQIRRRIALVCAVFRSPNAPMLSVQLSHHPLYQRPETSHLSLLPSSQMKKKHRGNKERNFSGRKISTMTRNYSVKSNHPSYPGVSRQAFRWLWSISFHIWEMRFTSWASDSDSREQKNL